MLTYTTILFAGRQRVLLIPKAWTVFTVEGRVYRRHNKGFVYMGRTV